jgi:hypothetical protein
LRRMRTYGLLVRTRSDARGHTMDRP